MKAKNPLLTFLFFSTMISFVKIIQRGTKCFLTPEWRKSSLASRWVIQLEHLVPVPHSIKFQC